jgi:DNA invertase Pin-like site-specific DNA recombinase
MRAAAYARISRTHDASDTAGVDRQLEDIRELARERGIEIVSEHVDNDSSAFSRSRKRPGWDALVAEIASGGVDCVIAWHPDRLYRRLTDLEHVIEAVEGNGVQLITCRAGEIDLGTPSGRMVARLLGSVAQHESEHGAARRARKHSELALQGRPSGGGRRPLGYSADGLAVVQEEAEVLREAADALLAGMTLGGAARQASQRLGRPVRTNVLKGSLTSHRVAGLRQHRSVEQRRRGEPGTVVPAVWPAILDEGRWAAVRALLTDPSRATPRGPAESRYWASGGGVLRCGRCGTALTGSAGRYRCPCSEPGSCGGVSGPQRGLEDLLERALLERARELGAGEVPVPAAAGAGAACPERARLEELRGRREALAGLLASGVLGEAEVAAAVAALDPQIRAAERALPAAEAAAEQARTVAVAVADAWDAALPHERRRALGVLAEKVLLHPAEAGRRNGNRFDPSRVEIRWRG